MRVDSFFTRGDIVINVKNILFPTDFSHTGDAALNLATSLARDSDATLHIVHVEEPPYAYGAGEMYYGMVEPSREQQKEMLLEVKPTDPNVRCEHHLNTGEPAKALVWFAKEHDVDLIVMGTHGRTGLMRLLMGSVTEAVVRRAHCPVLTYRQSHDEHKKQKAKPQNQQVTA